MNCSNSLLLALAVVFLLNCAEKEQHKSKAEVLENEEVTQLPYFNSALFTPEWDKGTHKIPEFSLTNQKGEKVTNKTFEGHIMWLIAFS